MQASGADGIYTVATRRPPPTGSDHADGASVTVEDSVLETVGDDGIILKTQAMTLMAAPRQPEIQLGGIVWLWHGLRVGDHLRFFAPRPSAQIHDLGTAVVTQVALGASPANGTAVTLSRDVGVTSENWASVLVYCDEAAAPGFLVRNTSVLGGRRWGLLIEGHDGRVEECTFANTSAEAIMVKW